MWNTKFLLLLTLVCLLVGCSAPAAPPSGQKTPTSTREVTITEFTVSSTDTLSESITAGPDGALWFTEQGKIGRITTTGKISEFPLSNSKYVPVDITAGPDRALWFTEELIPFGPSEGKNSKIGRITTTGKISEFPLPSSSSSALGITAGLDGALWFTEHSPDQTGISKIGRITTAGTISEFPIPTRNAAVTTGMTLGPDGALWFTEQLSNAIGRITTTGKISEYPLPYIASAQSSFFPRDITAGPDGNLWFTEGIPTVGASIGRITMTGKISEFPLPNSKDYPFNITAGPDGALWFTVALNPFGPEGPNSKIVRITTAGKMSELPFRYIAGTNSISFFPGDVTVSPSSLFPGDITAGPDGNLWFTEVDSKGGGKIGRLNIKS